MCYEFFLHSFQKRAFNEVVTENYSGHKKTTRESPFCSNINSEPICIYKFSQACTMAGGVTETRWCGKKKCIPKQTRSLRIRFGPESGSAIKHNRCEAMCATLFIS
ncbi:hypothetical protein CEXT_425881 [Caerostris extrusa]|uniref:Uncharacterized protein n=1 Tax=Caerostris extrusa TaxID=172846 RepID=A0AAV4SPB5_CAEEX|nr:hypothetical protein CEXT_425881 [Caerostris extrusa]